MILMTPKKSYEQNGLPWKIGELYWALPANDPDDDTGYSNIAQPARFMGFSEAGEELWTWLGSEVEDWPPRWVGDHIPQPDGLPGNALPIR